MRTRNSKKGEGEYYIVEKEELKEEIVRKVQSINNPVYLIDILGYVDVYYEDEEKKRVGN